MTTLYTTSQLANLLQVHRQTIYRWRREGLGPAHVRINGAIRYRSEDVEAWISERTKGIDKRGR